MNDTKHVIGTRPGPPAEPGMPAGEVDTPALVVDLDVFERNLRVMADLAAGAGMNLRPHAKTHKCIGIARRQIELGAVGVCCQKVSEAEILVAGGIRDVLVANEIAGSAKLARLAALARNARLAVCVDDRQNVPELAAAAGRAGASVDVLVEIEVGGERCGVADPDEALRIADAVDGEPSLVLLGLQAYHGGSQHIADHGERRDVSMRVADIAGDMVERMGRRGLPCRVVSGAGTGTVEFALESGVFTELQAGSYIFMDASYARNRRADDAPFDTFGHSLFVLTTVMSRPVAGRAVVDAGHKSASIDSGMPEVFARPGITYGRPADEHGVLESAGAALPARGERILLVPGHCDPTVNLHDWLVGVRDLHGAAPCVESLWAVDARGAVF